MIDHLSKYHKEIEKTFIKNYRRTRKSYSVEGIHKMRLSVKRLRAFLKLLNHFDDRPYTKKNLKKINLLYKHAGKVRDLQIQLNLLENFRPDAGNEFDIYITQLTNRKAKALKALKRSFKEIDIKDIVKISRRIENILKKIRDHNFMEEYSQIIRKKLKDIEDLSVALNDESVLHLIRRHMKELLFIRDTVNIEDQVLLANTEKLALMADIEVKLGEWHDLQVLLDSFLSLDHEGDSYRDILERIEKSKLLKQAEVVEKLEKISDLVQS